MANKHVNADKMATSQKAKQSAERKAAQAERGRKSTNPHTDGRGQSGQKK